MAIVKIGLTLCRQSAAGACRRIGEVRGGESDIKPRFSMSETGTASLTKLSPRIEHAHEKTMAHTIKVNLAKKVVTISDLIVTSGDFLSVVAARPESERERAVLDVIAVGSTAMLRVQTTIDVDFVEKQFAALNSKFERALDGFEKQATTALTKRFSPTESGSYTKQIGELVGGARKDFQAWTNELSKTSKDLLDPDKKGSAVGCLEKLVEETGSRFEQMFDPDLKGSYSARLSEQLSGLFGGNGRAGVLQASLGEAIKPILEELRQLKEKVEGRKAAEQVIASSSLKGPRFEELVHVRLSHLAQPFGDDLAAVGNGDGGSKAGDFLVTVNGSGKRVVVEARDRKQMSLPAIKQDLEREMKERSADVALYVSSRSEMLPRHVGEFQIYGEKLVTTLDNLPIAYRVARVMALMEAPDGEIDVIELRGILSKIKDAAHSLRNVKSKASQIEKLADGIQSDSGETERTILRLVTDAESLLSLEKSN